MSGEKQLLYPNEAGICFGLLPVAVQDGMKAAVANGAFCERYDGEKWVSAAFMGKGATLRLVLNPRAPIELQETVALLRYEFASEKDLCDKWKDERNHFWSDRQR